MKKFATIAACALAFGVLMEARAATVGIPARAIIAGAIGRVVLFTVSVAKRKTPPGPRTMLVG